MSSPGLTFSESIEDFAEGLLGLDLNEVKNEAHAKHELGDV